MNTSHNIPDSQSGIVDLRSDTVTRPTPEMYEAMMSARLGDDVLGDDPTVLELEAVSAQMTGKEAALFVPSGTMGNQIALACHINRGDAILVEEEAHILYYEVGGPAILAGALTITLPSTLGTMDPNLIESRIMKQNLHTPGTTLLCVENSHNRAGGTIVAPSVMAEYRQIADRYGMKMHLDGARMFNASVALGIGANELVQDFDSVSFCLSKGLGAPVGSVLCGSRDFIQRALIWRKRLGGGMRQSGILAACGLVSLRTMIDRLADDHRRAQSIAKGIDGVPGLKIDWERIQTNMVLIQTKGLSKPWLEALKEKEIWALPPASDKIRLVLHKDIDDLGVSLAISAFQEIASDLSCAI